MKIPCCWKSVPVPSLMRIRKTWTTASLPATTAPGGSTATLHSIRIEKTDDHIRVLKGTTVYADVFENEASLIKSAKLATVRYQGRRFAGRIDPAPAQFDGATRVTT